MDESFDELVPKNWLEVPGKHKLEEPTDASISKQPRLCASSSNGASLLALSPRTFNSENSNGTNEDTFVNEPDLFAVEDVHVKLEVNNNNTVIDGNDNKNPHLSCRIGDKNGARNLNENIKSTENGKLGLQGNKCLKYDPDSRVNSYHSKCDHEETLITGCQQFVGANESSYLQPIKLPCTPCLPGEASSSETISKLKTISSLVTDAKIIADVVPDKDFREIYQLLLEHRDQSDRLDIVTFHLTTSSVAAPALQHLPSATDIFEEVQLVAQAVPSADVNEVYALLEKMPPSSSRVQDVITKIKSSKSTSNEVGHTSHVNVTLIDSNVTPMPEDDSLLSSDPLFHDMRIIAKMFPEKDRNEIYALLEAKYHKGNRIESVINEILHGQAFDIEEKQQNQTAALQNSTISANNTDTIEHDMERMRAIFPDCDPNYLYEKLDNMKATFDRTTVLAAEMFEKRNYPKLKDLLDMELEKEKKHRAKHLTMSKEEFLQKFPDPVKTFADCTKKPSDTYKQHADILLKNEFPMLKSCYLKKVLHKHNGHLYPAYQEISTLFVQTPLNKRAENARFLKNKRPTKHSMPDTVDEYFYHELWFVYNELSLLDHIKEKELQRQLKIESARETNELHECCCCFDNECLLEDLASCPEGHLFCKTCVIRSTEAAFGEMKTRFPCLTGECSHDIPLSYIQTIVAPGLFSKILHRLQEEEVQQANIPDLVTCPFCHFAAIMSDPDDKVFKCLNPECLKESCRLCREMNHVPLRCNEVEKKAETNMRVYIENKISEAVMRKCHKCGKRFVKDDGCNKMTCICGANSCYACKATDIDYDHFNNNKKCADTDPNTIHQRDMEEAAIMAKNQYILDHPEAAEIELKSDVKDLIKDFKRSNTRGRKYLYVDNQDDDYRDDDGDNDYDDDYDHDYDDDYSSVDDYTNDDTDDFNSTYDYLDNVDQYDTEYY